ncbi:LacI family transcriptional regulator [Labrys miyagiensis]|uniref:LacI family transcriptional regulator n=1 Tax=Labrys miyagiensis TaxID=346912 RepID=A0ABQ6CNM6_9HYPH|nr:LacI family DNA-binding transcriptional regulator [Labrys miyagiensis]GLS19821.1 LacI family transcriptional regulator [Labrys miyagiensis]
MANTTLSSDEREAEEGSRPARLIDVARLAKVSRATAARALGGYGFVGNETRERVTAAAQKLNYRLNEVARAMRAGKTLAIGVVIADISNSFFAAAARAIIDTCAEHGYQALIINTDDDIAREIEAVRVLAEKRVDGLIVVPSSPDHNDHLRRVGELSSRLVLLDRRITDMPASTVTTDDRSGARDAVELFIARGHTRIGLLVSTVAVRSHGTTLPRRAVSTVRDRVAGAREALREAGLELPNAWVRYTRNDLPTVTQAALSILGMEPRPTAILATCEEMAVGAMAACRELGLTIGKDIALISFDESPWSRVLTPAISVVQRPIYEMGRAAVTTLVRQIRGGVAPQAIELPTVLVDRESVFDLTG